MLPSAFYSNDIDFIAYGSEVILFTYLETLP